MDNLEKAISGALDQHAEAERAFHRFEIKLTAAIYNKITERAAETQFLTEAFKASTALLSTELAADFAEDLPNFLARKAGSAVPERVVVAEALNDQLVETISSHVAMKTILGLQPIWRKREDEARKRQPPMVTNVEVTPQIDLGAYAKDQAAQFELEDARKAAPVAPAPVAFHEEDQMAAIERTASVQRRDYPAKKGKRNA